MSPPNSPSYSSEMTNYATITLVPQSVWASTMLGLGTRILLMVALMDPY